MDRLSSGSMHVPIPGAIARRATPTTPAPTAKEQPNAASTGKSFGNISNNTMVRQVRSPEPSGEAAVRAAELRLANAYREDPKEFALSLAAQSLEELATTVTNA